MVDLPGYGYAKVSKKTKSVFQQFITDYFERREQLVCAFVLIDIRHEAQKIDIEFMSYMGESEIPFCIIFTKADKISKVKIDAHIAAYKKKMFAKQLSQRGGELECKWWGDRVTMSGQCVFYMQGEITIDNRQ